MTSYDFIVIGGGPGGYVAAIRAAHHGAKVALIEKDERLGGTCLLRGCIPTKALLHAADVLTEIEHGREVGIMAKAEVDFALVQRSRQKAVDRSAAGVAYLMKQNRIDVLRGRGELAGPHEVLVEVASGETQTVTGKAIVIATGSVPKTLGLAIDGARIITSDEALALARPPKSLLVLGAGAVGVELASLYSRFGAKTTIVELLDRPLPLEDEEVSAELARALQKRGLRLLLGSKLETLEAREGGAVAVVVDSAGAKETIEVETALVAVGRAPVTSGLGLEALGVVIDKGGYVEVDGFMRTAVPHIYAVGDIVRTPALAHVASAEGILAADHALGHDARPLAYQKMPQAMYADPEVASVGLSESAAKAAGYDVAVGKFPFSALGKARIIGRTEGFVKVVAERKYDEVLGVHIIGPHATDLISEAALGLHLETTAEELSHTVHPHPTLSEAVLEAAFAARGRAIHL